MGNIHFSINIERVDMLIALGVLIIALIALIGIFAWWRKSTKEIKTLENIDRNLEYRTVTKCNEEKDSKVQVTVINNENSGETILYDGDEETYSRQGRRSRSRKNKGSKGRFVGDDFIENNKAENEEVVRAALEPEPEQDQEPMIDIAALVAQNQIDLERKAQEQENQGKCSIGKSGKVYTEEELKELINN